MAGAVLTTGIVASAPAVNAAAATASVTGTAVTPTAAVHPSHGLTVGDPVTVTGAGLPPRTQVDVVECSRSSSTGDGPQGCPALTTVTVSSHGTISVHLAVQDPVYYQGEAGDPYPVYCRADQCQFFIEWTDAGGLESIGSQVMYFHGAPATIAAAPATGLADGEQVHVTGTATRSSGHSVVIVEQSCYDLVQGTGCNGTLTLKTLPLPADGTFSGWVAVSRYLADGEDCVDLAGYFGCELSVEVLNARGVPDDSFGVSRLGRPAATIVVTG
jgi:hypothetical protein